MSARAIETVGLSEDLRSTLSLSTPRPAGRARRGLRLPGPERRRQDDDDPAAARAAPSDRRPGRAVRRRRVARPGDGASAGRLRRQRAVPVAGSDRRRDARLPRDGCARETDRAYRDVLVERFQLDTSKKVRALSHGNRQKVQLIAAFASRADLLILDEPTGGLDPLMEMAFRETVREAKERGQTVFLSSHILSEVEAVCDRVGILRAGAARRPGDAGRAPPPRAPRPSRSTFDGRRPDAPGAAGRRGRERGRERAALRGERRHRAAASPRSPTSRWTSLDEPRALARGDLPAPLRGRGRTVPGASAIARRAFADARVRTISFALLLFAFAAYLQATAYREGYPTLEDRLAVRARASARTMPRALLYGEPHDLLTVGGYVSWRVGGTPRDLRRRSGACSAPSARCAPRRTRAARSSCSPGVVGRRMAFAPSSRRSAPAPRCCGSRSSPRFVAGELPAGGSAYLALAIVSVVPVFAGVGALASQLAPTKRLATGLSTGVLALAFALRTVAAITSGGGWSGCAGLTPLGWAGELRPFADPQPLVLLLPVASDRLLLVMAARAGGPPRHRQRPAAVAGQRQRRGCACSGRRSRRRCATSAAGLVAWLRRQSARSPCSWASSPAPSRPTSSPTTLQDQLEKLGAELDRDARRAGSAFRSSSSSSR